MDYILKVLNEESSEWEPIEAIKGADGEPGPAGPQGEPGTTEWTGIDNKPFETIGEGLSVDSEGVLSSTGGEGLKIFEYKYQYTLDEVAEMGPGSAIFINVFGTKTLYYYFNEAGGSILFQSPANINYTGGSVSYGILSVSRSNGSVSSGGSPILLVPDTWTGNPGDVLTINTNGNNIEWTEPQDPLPALPTSDGTYTLQCTVTDGVATYSWV